MFLKYTFKKRLSKRVSKVLLGCYLSNRRVSSINEAAIKWYFLNMFLPFVRPGFFGLCYGPIIITVKDNRSIYTWHDMKIQKEFFLSHTYSIIASNATTFQEFPIRSYNNGYGGELGLECSKGDHAFLIKQNGTHQ